MLGAYGVLGHCVEARHCVEAMRISHIAAHSAVQGFNAFGQVGDGTTTDRLTPALPHFDGWWRAAATGDHHSCGIRGDGSLWCWVSAWHWKS